MTILEEMIEVGADGVVFHSILQHPSNVKCEIYKEYTFEEYKNVTAFPKSGRTYYRIVNGKREWI